MEVDVGRKIQGMKVVAVVSFSQTFPSCKERNDVAAFVSWLLVAKHDALYPSQIMVGEGEDLDCSWLLQWSNTVMRLISLPRQLKSICNLLNHPHSISTPCLGLSKWTIIMMMVLEYFQDMWSIIFLRLNRKNRRFQSFMHSMIKNRNRLLINSCNYVPGACATSNLPQWMTQSLMKDTKDMWQIWCRFPPPRVQGIRLHYSDFTIWQSLAFLFWKHCALYPIQVCLL